MSRTDRLDAAGCLRRQLRWSGLTALGSEVVWTRLLSLMFGATTYAFSIILGVFLAGLGIGSVVGSSLARDSKRARLLLGWIQFLIALAIAFGAFHDRARNCRGGRSTSGSRRIRVRVSGGSRTRVVRYYSRPRCFGARAFAGTCRGKGR